MKAEWAALKRNTDQPKPNKALGANAFGSGQNSQSLCSTCCWGSLYEGMSFSEAQHLGTVNPPYLCLTDAIRAENNEASKHHMLNNLIYNTKGTEHS